MQNPKTLAERIVRSNLNEAVHTSLDTDAELEPVLWGKVENDLRNIWRHIRSQSRGGKKAVEWVSVLNALQSAAGDLKRGDSATASKWLDMTKKAIDDLKKTLTP